MLSEHDGHDEEERDMDKGRPPFKPFASTLKGLVLGWGAAALRELYCAARFLTLEEFRAELYMLGVLGVEMAAVEVMLIVVGLAVSAAWTPLPPRQRSLDIIDGLFHSPGARNPRQTRSRRNPRPGGLQ